MGQGWVATGGDKRAVTPPPESIGGRRCWATAHRALRIILSLVFLFAGAAKLWQEPHKFADSIASFRLLPLLLVSPLVLTLPPFEVLVGIALMINRPKRLGSFCAFLLSTIFLVALATAILRGISVDCGCFGSGPGWLRLTTEEKVWLDVARDSLMAIGSFVLYRHEMMTVSATTRS